MKQQTFLADDQIIVGHGILDPGERSAEHVHVALIETILVLRGRLSVERDDGTITLAWAPNDRSNRLGVPVIHAGVAHAVANASATEPVEFIVVMRKIATEAP